MPLNYTTSENPFTGDGDFLLATEDNHIPLPKPGSRMIVEASGTFGTATVKPYWVDLAGSKQYLLEDGVVISATSPNYWSFLQPLSRILGVEVSGSDGSTELIFNISKGNEY